MGRIDRGVLSSIIAPHLTIKAGVNARSALKCSARLLAGTLAGARSSVFDEFRDQILR